MKFLLDTDSVSFALRGHGDVGARIRERKPSELCISAITLAELRYGADRKGSRRLHSLIDTGARCIAFTYNEPLGIAAGHGDQAIRGGNEHAVVVFSGRLAANTCVVVAPSRLGGWHSHVRSARQ